MNVVPRIPITSAMITSTNVTDSPDYAAATTYALGDTVKDPATFLEYTSQQAANLGNDPASDDGTWWLNTGYANSRRMVDGLLAGQTENAATVELVLDIGELFTSVVCFNVSAATVNLTIVEDAIEIHNETISMVRTDDVENVWDYFFTDPEFKTVAIFASAPGFSGATATLTVTSTGTAKIGEAIFGYGRFIGDTLEGSGTRFKDYSVKEANVFGDFTVVERSYSRGAEFVVGINPEENDRIQRIFEANRAKVCAFFPSSDMEHYGLTVAGFFKNYEPGLTHRGVVPVTIQIEGLALLT